MKKNIVLFCLLSMTFLSEGFSSKKNAFTLDEILTLGIQNNPSLAARHQETLARRAAYDSSRRLSNPELELHRGKGETRDGSETLTTDGLTLTQTLENPFKRHYRIQMSENDWQAAEYLYDSSKLDLEYSLKNLFYKILLLKKKEKDVEFARNNTRYIQWQRFPDFSLSGFIENEIDGRNQGIGLSFELPLWDFKSKKIAEAEYLLIQQEEE